MSMDVPVVLDEAFQKRMAPCRAFKWDDYMRGRNGVVDPLRWLEGVSPAAHAEFLATLVATHKRPFVPLSHHTCASTAVMLYLQWLENPSDWQTAFDECHTLPFAILGHRIVFVHCDPEAKPPACIPPWLAVCVWVPAEDYLQVRADFEDRARTLAPLVSHLAPARLAERPTGDDLKSALQWVVKLPTIDVTERNAIDFMLALPDGEMQKERLTPELVCSLREYFEPSAGGYPLIPASALRIDPRALERAHNRDACSKLLYIPYAITTSQVFVVAESITTSVLDEVAKGFPGLKPVYGRGSADSIRSRLTDGVKSKGRAMATFTRDPESDVGTLPVLDPTRFPTGATARSFHDKPDELLDFLLCDALGERATDIHLDSYSGQGRVRFRIDGKLITSWAIQYEMLWRIANKLRDNFCKFGKETQNPLAPQEGSTNFAYQGRRIGIRISIGFTHQDAKKPKIVLRILDKASGVLDLSQLGLFPDELAIVRRNIERPNGLILCAGATGDGKSTTVNACLRDVNSSEVAIATMEDPIEFVIPGVAQFETASKADERTAGRISFTEGLRMMLRQDPDILMLGELRDYETMSGAVDASNTGHLVFSTVHSNSAPQTITRCIGLLSHGKPDQAAENRSAFATQCRLIVAQKLVRKLCSCRELVPVPEEARELMLRHKLECSKYIGRPRGCARCKQRGYYGRVVVPELLELDKALVDLITDGATSRDLRQAAEAAKGFSSLFRAGLRRVAANITTLEALRDAMDAE